MTFHLTKRSSFNTDKQKEEYERLGFRFTRTVPKDFPTPDKKWRDITWESADIEIEFTDLNTLVEFAKKYDGIGIYEDFEGTLTLEIIDGY